MIFGDWILEPIHPNTSAEFTRIKTVQYLYVPHTLPLNPSDSTLPVSLLRRKGSTDLYKRRQWIKRGFKGHF